MSLGRTHVASARSKFLGVGRCTVPDVATITLMPGERCRAVDETATCLPPLPTT
jgi:hypothetical protein